MGRSRIRSRQRQARSISSLACSCILRWFCAAIALKPSSKSGGPRRLRGGIGLPRNVVNPIVLVTPGAGNPPGSTITP